MNEKIRGLQATYASLCNDVKPLVEKSKAGTLSTDEDARFDDLTAQINKCRDDIKTEEKRYNDALSLEQDIATATKPTEKRSLVNGEPQQAKSIGQQFAESDVVKKHQGNGRSQPFDVGSFYAKHKVQHRDGMGPEQVKALIQTGNLPADYIAPTMVPGFFRMARPTATRSCSSANWHSPTTRLACRRRPTPRQPAKRRSTHR